MSGNDTEMKRRAVLGMLGSAAVLGAVGTVSGKEVDVENSGLLVEYPDPVTLDADSCSGSFTLTVDNQTGDDFERLQILIDTSSIDGDISVGDANGALNKTVDGDEVELFELGFSAGVERNIGITLDNFSGNGSSPLIVGVFALGSQTIQTDPSLEIPIEYACGDLPSGCPVGTDVTVDLGNNPSGPISTDDDLTLKNEDVDGNVTIGGDLDLKKAAIDGKTEVDGGIGTFKSTEIAEDVISNGDIGDTAKDIEVGGDLKTVDTDDDDGGDISIKNSTVSGRVESSGDVGTFKSMVVGGSVVANGDIGDTATNNEIGGNLKTIDTDDDDGGDININNSTICGKISSSGSIGTFKNTVVGGEVVANGDIGDTAKNVEIGGDLRTVDTDDDDGGDIDIKASTVEGGIESAGSIGTFKNVDVADSVTANGDIGDTAKNVEIGGDLKTVNTDDDDGGDIDIKSSTVEGKIEATGSIGTFKNVEVADSVTANGDIGDTAKNVEIGGDLKTVDTEDDDGGDIDIKSSTVEGGIESAGNIGTFKDTDVSGSVVANGDVGSTATNVDIGGDLKTVNTDDDDGGDIDIKNATVDGELSAVGTITIKSGEPVDGDINTTGDVAVDGTLDGDIYAEGDVSVSGTVKGNVSAEGEVDGGGTITGYDPRGIL